MLDNGSVQNMESGAAKAAGQRVDHSAWFCSWDVVEALARDVDALTDKCHGGKCSFAELKEWRERIHALLKTALDEEERIFAALEEQERQDSMARAQPIQSISAGAGQS